jgi:hypothetical protein
MKYSLRKSVSDKNYWVFADTENQVVIRFEEFNYNVNQKVTILNENLNSTAEVARILREMGEWIVRYHASICFSSVHAMERSEDNRHLFFKRTKTPKFSIEILESSTGKALRKKLRDYANSLRDLDEIYFQETTLFTPEFSLTIEEQMMTTELISCINKAAASLVGNYYYRV